MEFPLAYLPLLRPLKRRYISQSGSDIEFEIGCSPKKNWIYGLRICDFFRFLRSFVSFYPLTTITVVSRQVYSRPLPCQNGGTITLDEKEAFEFKCLCVPGFYGKRCEIGE